MNLKKALGIMALSLSVLSGSVVVSAVAPTAAEASFYAPMYKQYDAQWGADLMGGGDTLSQSGCAVSSIAMALAFKGTTVSGATATPKNLNTYLKNNGGYSGNSVVWGVPANLGSNVSFTGRYRVSDGTMPSAATLRSYLDGGKKAIIANVRSGGHWVLLTNHNGGTTFNVNDPGYSSTTYTYADMVGAAIYTFTN